VSGKLKGPLDETSQKMPGCLPQPHARMSLYLLHSSLSILVNAAAGNFLVAGEDLSTKGFRVSGHFFPAHVYVYRYIGVLIKPMAALEILPILARLG